MVETLSMQNIKNIIFDLGNVLIDLDMVKFEKTMKELWGKQYEVAIQEGERLDIFNKFETGDMSEETFMWHWQNLSGKLNDNTYNLLQAADISKAWNSCLLYTSPSPRDATLSRMPSSA